MAFGNCENVAEFLCFDKFKCDKVITKPPLDHSFSNSYSFFGSSRIWKLEFMVFEKLLNRSHQRGKNISQNVAHCYAVTVQGTRRGWNVQCYDKFKCRARKILRSYTYTHIRMHHRLAFSQGRIQSCIIIDPRFVISRFNLFRQSARRLKMNGEWRF